MFLERLSEYGADLSGYEGFGCTSYAKKRMEEADGVGAYQMFSGRSKNGFPEAKDFYRYWKFEKGTAPKVGSIACWGSAEDLHGHVAYVERVNPDGSILVSQSNWGGVRWELKTYFVNAGQVTAGVGYVFNGFCYSPYVKDIRHQNKPKNGLKTALVTAERVRARIAPDGEQLKGLYIPMGLYSVLEEKQAGAYNWARLDAGVWFALGEWSIMYDAEKDEATELKEELDKANSKLRKIGALLNE